MASFAERLRALRIAKGLSQQDLSKQIGSISKSSINMYERGEREPSFETLEAFADYFNVDLDYLMGKSDIANSVRDWPPEYEDLLRQMVAERISGRDGAREAMIQTHGTENTAHSTRIVDKKHALLYYHAFDNSYHCTAVSSMLELMQDATPDDAERLYLLALAYTSADDRARQMVDLALDPFLSEDIKDWVGSLVPDSSEGEPMPDAATLALARQILRDKKAEESGQASSGDAGKEKMA